MTYRNARLLQLAKGAPCLATIPGICNGNSETVVAAHSNALEHGKGVGHKSADCYITFACQACHDAIDARTPRLEPDQGEVMAEHPILFSGPMVRAILERAVEVRRLHSSGHTTKELAAHFGCSTHPIKQALKVLGLKRPAKRRPDVGAGDRNPAWRGGRRTRPDGYIAVWTPAGERLEHQIVMEKHLGRSLRSGEIVHHIDGVKGNNNLANLKLTNQSDHIREHLPQMHRARYGR